MLLLCLLVIGGFAVYVMTPAERTRLVHKALPALRAAKTTAIEIHTARDPFFDALRERTPWPIVTPAIVLLNVLVFFRMVMADGSIGDPDTLLAWGASFGPKTTNGEWWRLLTSLFVHAGPLHLLTDVAGMALAGVLLERLIGHFAFATVYLGAGIFASLASLSADPMAIAVGSSGAIFGLYGLLLASAVWGALKRSLTIPLLAVKQMAPGAVLFLLYSLATGGMSTAALNGFVLGFISGLVLAWGVSEQKTPAIRSAGALAATLVIVIAAAVPLRGFTDVKPEIALVLAVEDRTTAAYDRAVKQFQLGALDAESLAKVIDTSVLPELLAVSARIKSLERVPAEHKPLVDKAEEYLRVRAESWRLRAHGLRQHEMPTVQRADRTARAALDVYDAIKSVEDKSIDGQQEGVR
jgi:membrane associated rhomboid family serine protease